MAAAVDEQHRRAAKLSGHSELGAFGTVGVRNWGRNRAVKTNRLVCLSSVTLVRPNQVVVIFGNFSMAFGTLAILWHAQKILWRSSQGNPSVRRVKPKRGSKI